LRGPGHAYANSNGYAYCDSDGNRDANSNTYGNSDGDTNTDAYTDSYANAYSYTYARADHAARAWLQSARPANGRPLLEWADLG